MRAGWYERAGDARDVLVVGEMPAPEPGPGEVRVKVRVSGINPGDVKKRADWLTYGMPFPRVIPHSDGAGVIDAVGSGVPDARIGERAWVWGALNYRPFGTAAEYVTRAAGAGGPVAGSRRRRHGACLGISARTAHRCVFADGPVAGGTALVAGGAGNVGHAAVALASWAGARVIAMVGTLAHVDLVRAAGATHVLDRHLEDLADRILDATEGIGVDRIIEVAPGANLGLDQKVIANGGVIAAYASDGDPEPRLPFWPLLFRNAVIRLVGSDDLPEAAGRAAVAGISACLAAGRLRPLVARVFPLERIEEAHVLVETGRATGHVLLDIVDDAAG